MFIKNNNPKCVKSCMVELCCTTHALQTNFDTKKLQFLRMNIFFLCL